LNVLVGNTRHGFFNNKSLICSKSEFFNAACKKEWASGQSSNISNTVVLDEENPETFNIFLVWLTTGTIKGAANLVRVPTSDIELKVTTTIQSEGTPTTT
jgi:hypothetical protein